MATEFTQDAVMRFICSRNGRVKNADLLVHFKVFLREDENRAQNRELFKRFVNSVAVVKQEEGASFVVLRKKYMGLVRYVGDTSSHKVPCEKTAKDVSSREDPEKGQASSQTDLKVKGKKTPHIDHVTKLQNTDKVFPVAGIVNNNTETINLEANANIKPSNTVERLPPPGPVTGTDNRSCTLKPPQLHLQSELNESGERCQQIQTPGVAGEAVSQSSQSPILTGDRKESICIAEQGPFKEPFSPNESSSSSLDCLYNEIKIIVPENVIGNNGLRRLGNESQERTLESVSGMQYLYTEQASNPRLSSSTPCLLDCSEAANTLPDHQLVTRSNGSLPRSKVGHRSQSRGSNGEDSAFSPQVVRHSLPLENARSYNPAGFAEHNLARLSTSHSDLLLPSYENSEWPRSWPKEEWSSDDSLYYKGLQYEHGAKVREMLQRAQEARMVSQLHRSESKAGPMHHSTGNLDDKGPGAARASSGSATPVLLRPGARRTRSRLRSRLCRSLGADLDQPFFEDGVSARLNRLQLLSSSLSFNYSTPSRAHSDRDLSSPDIPSSRIQPVGDGSFFHRSSMVPLDSREHDWLVKAASGTWPDIYSLFREEPSLLDKRDFISGYTVLHWIAKHGDHRVLNTLWYGVSKMGMKLNVDAKTTCGYTPLHLAAIHGHKKLIRLLVHKFKADVALRDTSGKKPWQYVDRGGPRDILQLLGAPFRKTGGRATRQPPSEKLMTRPTNMSPKVKRHASIAAFLKHKTLLKVPGNSESFV